MKTFIVKSSNANSKGGFVTKIQSEIEVNTPFGVKLKKETYYVSGSNQLTVDEPVPNFNLNMFSIAEYDMTNPATGEVFKAKWLHLA